MIDNMEARIKSAGEWVKQAEYDFRTAAAMLETGRYIYLVFMCHLSVEKLLKGIYVKRYEKNPAKTHDLNYLLQEISLSLPPDLSDFVEDLNALSVPTRYPNELEKAIRAYSKERSEEIFQRTGELIAWLQKNC